MERTESLVVQVAPEYENDKIKEMEMFGWNLQSRQEIMGHLQEAETPDNLFVAIGRGTVEGSTGKKTYEYDHYVKLHLVRDSNLPNLSEIKKLETEYFNLPFPKPPTLMSFIWPSLLFFGGLISLTNPETGAAIFASLLFGGLGGWWFYSKVKKRQKNLAICNQTIKRQEELINQLQSQT